MWYQRSQTLVQFSMMLLRTAETAFPMQGIPSPPNMNTSTGFFFPPTALKSAIISIHKRVQFISSSLPAPPKSQLKGNCNMQVGKNWCRLTSHRVCMCVLLSHSGHDLTLPHPHRDQLPPRFAKMLLFSRSLKYSKGTVTLGFARYTGHNI